MTWRFVDADDDLVADLLAGTVELVLELGGWLHPQARLVARDGHVHVECHADDGEPLVRVPAEAFVRIGRITWGDGADALTVDDVPDDLTGAEQELLILQTALHNACGKVPWLAATHPVLAPDLAPGVIDAVRAFRPSFRLRQPTAASLLWSTRAFRLPTSTASQAEPVAVPIVDLLDHRAGGATGTWTGDAFTVDVRHGPRGSHAWLDYGLQRDPLGMAVVYGFADTANPVAHSAPLTLDVPDVGRIRVAARGRARTGELLPIVVTTSGEQAVISRLTFGWNNPEDLAADLGQAAGWDRPTAQRVVRAVAERNVALARHLVEQAETDPSAAATILAEAARRHRELTAPYAVAPTASS